MNREKEKKRQKIEFILGKRKYFKDFCVNSRQARLVK